MQAAIADADSSGMVICGAAGVGKSRIAREGLRFAESNGCQIHWAVGTSSARELPLGAFAPWAGKVAADDLQLVRGVIDALTSTQRGTGSIVGVDDVHLLDDLSTFALHQIVQRGTAKVVLTLRDGEPVHLQRKSFGGPASCGGWTFSRSRGMKRPPWSRRCSVAPLIQTLRTACGC